MIKPTGSWVALITPFTNDLQVDFDGFKTLIDFHIAAGTDGLLLCGSTGEPTLLSIEERKAICDIVFTYTRDRIPAFIGTTCGSTAETITLSRYAEDTGADGLLLVAPGYVRPPQAALFEHFSTVAESVKVPIAIYNNPSRVGINIDPETILRLAEIPNIIADKEAMPNLSQLETIMGAAGDQLNLMCCDYPGFGLILPTLAMGGHGTANVSGNVIPEELAAMSKPWEQIEDVHRTRELYFRYLPLLKAMYWVSNPVPVKAALNLLGLPAGSCRPPLPNLSPDRTEQLHRLMIELGVIEKYSNKI